jgi:hypothetical protein
MVMPSFFSSDDFTVCKLFVTHLDRLFQAAFSFPFVTLCRQKRRGENAEQP